MKYLFVLGRNIELSLKEVGSYLKRTKNKIINSSLRENGFFVEVSEKIDSEAIRFLGGVLRIGEVIDSFSISDIKKALDKHMIYSGEKNNINYAVWDFSENYSEVLDYLKKRFKEEKLKASLKGLSKRMEMQKGDSEGAEDIFIPSSKLIDEEYFVFSFKGLENFGRIVQKSDYEEIERRDMERPVRRPSLDISPRLAKIMINLSLVEPNSEKKILDPFCGVGVILTESLLQGISCFGVDNDRKAIDGAKKNLKWSGFPEENYNLFFGDSREINIPEIEGIVTEPDLGSRMKKIPTKEKAEKQLKEFERLIVQVINNLKKKNSGRFVFSSPEIRIGKKRLSCDVENICSRTNYRPVFDGISESRKGQIVGRKIFVLEKE